MLTVIELSRKDSFWIGLKWLVSGYKWDDSDVLKGFFMWTTAMSPVNGDELLTCVRDHHRYRMKVVSCREKFSFICRYKGSIFSKQFPCTTSSINKLLRSLVCRIINLQKKKSQKKY